MLGILQIVYLLECQEVPGETEAVFTYPLKSQLMTASISQHLRREY